MTVAISLLIHGEAVRFNRGQSRGDDYDFKYLKGRDGREYPYVSSQCYKKYWRESLPGPASPITREKDALGKEKNQAYTDGNPIKYMDDDLFGYMIAGAAELEQGPGAEGESAMESPEDVEKSFFTLDDIKDAEALVKRLQDTNNPLSQFVLESTSAEVCQTLKAQQSSTEDIQRALVEALNDAAKKEELYDEKRFEGVKGLPQVKKKLQKLVSAQEKLEVNKLLLQKAFAKEIQPKEKRPTTKRAAPIRMHALVAFSGIKTAKDFQTFSRDVAYTGKNSIVNPTPQGIYSGWLKTRILIESHRIGKFYLGQNLDILADLAQDLEIRQEANPYSRDSEKVRYVQLDEPERTARLRAALRALADIGNKQGPASGALHDGSLRPKAFVAGLMKCADSPFDYVWKGQTDGMPHLDVSLLVNSIKDWDDLFAAKKIYVGLPVDADTELKETVEVELKNIGFEPVVDAPRKALLKLAEEAVL